jgi:uncharacterized protein (DUF1800 family)
MLPILVAPPAITASFQDDTPLTQDQRILHALGRLGFGARPGDVEKIKKIGLGAYIARQLQPEKIDDAGVEKAVTGLYGAQMSAEEIRQHERAFVMANVDAVQTRKKLEDAARESGIDTSGEMTPVQLLQKLPPEKRQTLLGATQKGAQARQEAASIGGGLVAEKFLRAVESERQLQEVLVDFWSNHFNIDMGKARTTKAIDERLAIRPHVLGKFRELLGASAKSPAMLIYLDNYQSVAASSGDAFARRRRPGAQKMPRGLNENYARELMELHTLGVDGGYTQKDVTEVARCLTGWSIDGNRYGGTFQFRNFAHDRGEKTVLGVNIPGGRGIEDGEQVLDLLARHPSTMRNVSTKLCRRFVADEPPVSLVNKCVATWQKTDGDLREVVRTIVTSDEFFAPQAYKKKLKSPFEFVVSSARALGATCRPQALQNYKVGIGQGAIRNAGGERTLSGQVSLMGQPIYAYSFPTGYPEDSRKWVSAGQLIARLNFALTFVDGGLYDIDFSRGLRVDAITGGTPALVDFLSEKLVGGQLSPGTRATLLKQADTLVKTPEASKLTTARRVAALVLGSPEFQRR